MNIANRSSVGHNARARRSEQGLTLLEMMIALAIGSWVIMAVIGLYLSVAHAALFQQGLNKDQQGLQYVQHFFSNRLQQASAVSSDSTSNVLVLQYRGALGSQGQITDCTGQAHGDSNDWLESIAFDEAGRITCHGAVLLDDVADLSLRYGVDQDRNHYLQEREYLSAGDLNDADWPKVEAIRVEFSVINNDKTLPHTHLLYFALHQKIMGRVNHEPL
ncbi:PilW family protein [Kushneria sp. Sum13]|uniref:PilW family protein n=1 Tax=Kushneria sp. Sum13 TaxID=3459196 RepID=UPI004045264E